MPGMPFYEQERRYVDLTQERNLFGYSFADNEIQLPQTVSSPNAVMNPAIFRCTMSAIPETQEMLKKSRMPLGLTLHPFRDLKNLTVIQTNIVRCRYCRTYINPYVMLPDHRHWKCNLCFRANDRMPEEFLFDPATKQYGDPRNRPELQQCTMEYIAPAEYMLRAPQPAVYLLRLRRYLYAFSEQLLLNLDQMPGDGRTQIGFMAYDSNIHFFEFFDKNKPPRELILPDVEGPFLPVPTGLLVGLREFHESIRSFIERIPTVFEKSTITSSCLGTALGSAYQLVAATGGRVTVMTCSRPSVGQGTLKPLDLQAKDSGGFAPTSDFYKRFALECTSQQVGVDIFALNVEYVDLATLADASKYSSGTVYHFPNYHINREQLEVLRFQRLFSRYLTRKVGFEAVLRIRCSKGLSLHTFHGNFFVRSTDLLAMANVNPDSALSVQIQYEEDLKNQSAACFQAALLYTSSKGDRRIRVHTLCIPICHDIQTVFATFDTKASIALLAKMAAERALSGGQLSDCRDALINGAVDTLAAYNRSIGMRPGGICAPIHGQLKFFSLFVLGLLKHPAFVARTRLNKDEHVSSLLRIKAAPVELILNEIYPVLYAIQTFGQTEELQRLPLSYERINADGVYFMDAGRMVLIYAPLEQLPNQISQRVHDLIRRLHQERCVYAPVVVVREDGQRRDWFTSRLVDDRTESAHSYVEFVQHITQEIRR
ncbi:Sec23/Sec24 trunk domain-containing protein [Aphelenchoides fujianensis]|nr:Sec23/Sec24 trunk domain-containing protein [Aphelenchoides fujianensis]